MWKYAGKKITAEQLQSLNLAKPKPVEAVDLEGAHYFLAEGYLVPRYPIEETPADRTVAPDLFFRDRLAVDLARRFFRYAEQGIDVRRSKEEIKAMVSAYDTAQQAAETATATDKTAATEAARAAGALLTGAIVSRMQRLARAYYAHTRGWYGSHEEYLLEEPHTKEQCFAELGEWTQFIAMHEEVVKCVRNQNGAPEVDEVPWEMVSELWKLAKVPPDQIDEGRAHKIGEAMRDMDKLAEVVKPLIAGFGDKTKPANVDATALSELFGRLVDSAKYRIGMKTDDAKGYDPAEIELKTNLRLVSQQLDALFKAAHTMRNMRLLQDLLNVKDAVNMVDTMSDIRMNLPNGLKALLDGIAQHQSRGPGV